MNPCWVHTLHCLLLWYYLIFSPEVADSTDLNQERKSAKAEANFKGFVSNSQAGQEGRTFAGIWSLFTYIRVINSQSYRCKASLWPCRSDGAGVTFVAHPETLHHMALDNYSDRKFIPYLFAEAICRRSPFCHPFEEPMLAASVSFWVCRIHLKLFLLVYLLCQPSISSSFGPPLLLSSSYPLLWHGLESLHI